MARLSRRGGGRSLFVPMDHTVTDGPFSAGRTAADLAATFAAAGVDGMILHKGQVRTIRPEAFAEMGLIVHLSAGTTHHRDRNSKVLVASVEEAVRLGADAVSVHVNIGSEQEPRQLVDLGQVAGECERLGIPLMAMMYARGESLARDPDCPTMIAHLGSIAVDLGADMVKLPYPGSAAGCREVVAGCPLPVYVAGGAPRDSLADDLEMARTCLHAGAAGLSFGRCVFQAEDPYAAAVALADAVHDRGPAQRHAALASVPAETNEIEGIENHG